MILFFVALYFIAKAVFTILWYASPVLIGAALFFDYKGVLGFGKWLGNLIRRNPLVGIGATALCVIGFPVVALFLFSKAMLKKKVKEMNDQYEGQAQTANPDDYIDFEEVEFDEPKMELPPLRMPENAPKKSNEYDSLFD